MTTYLEEQLESALETLFLELVLAESRVSLARKGGSFCGFLKSTWGGSKDQPKFKIIKLPRKVLKTVKQDFTSHFIYTFWKQKGGDLVMSPVLSGFIRIRPVLLLFFKAGITHTQVDRRVFSVPACLWVNVAILLWGTSLWDQSAPGGVIVQLLPSSIVLKG